MTRTTFRIGLDARADLLAANQPATDEAIEDFIERYTETAAKIATEKAITIRLVTGISYGGPTESYDTDEAAMELWQELHNRTT